MMKKRHIFLLLIILISMISISAASAADDITGDAIASNEDQNIISDVSVNDDTYGASDDELFLESNADESTLSESSAGTFADLNNDINGNSDSTIYLTRNYTFAGGNDYYPINIDRAVTIYGNGITIKGASDCSIFYISDDVTLTDINFVNSNDGAICITPYHSNVNINNCTFIENHAESQGGAIYVGGGCTNININNCTFIENHARLQGGAISVYGTNVIAFNCTFISNTATQGGAMYGGSAVLCRFVEDSDTTFDTNIITSVFSVYDLTTAYNSGEKLLFNLTCNEENYDGFNTTISIFNQSGDLVGTYYALSGEGWVVDLVPGTYNAVLSLDKYEGVTDKTVTITVNKLNAAIRPLTDTIDLFVGDSSQVDYSLNPSGAGDIKFTSSNPNVVTVDSNGNIKAVGAGTARITISLSSSNYEAKDATVTITVSKKDSQITASAKSYKFEDKTKTYTVTLKDKKGNVLKNKKVTLKVGGATYTATTNNNGVATFKLSKLTKQGTFTAVISYAGDKYYNKATKNAKLTVKAPAWKTVSKGSKDKAMVKKIQKALKSNGYYLSYKGRYLKIDGLFHKYTEMAVKQFQKAKKLKVTGKVDYATAKKLKLI